jgi:hypothetical protein
VADKRAEKNFHFIMEVIRSQAVKKIYHQAMREMQKLDSETHKRKVSLKEVRTKMKHNPAPI